MKHSKFTYVLPIVESGMPVLLEGPAGTGKSTLAMQIAESLALSFHSISCTKQMSVNALLGFISINGVYIRTQFREAFEHGGLFLLDEIDAADPNVLLTLNTIENGFISFPDGIVKAHESFRLIATANPSNEHSIYTGRSKLDFSTKDRFFTITIDRDESLELSLTSPEILANATVARKLLIDHGITTPITMRDTIRMHRLHTLGITECVYHDVVFHKHPDIYSEFTSHLSKQAEEARKVSMTQADAITFDELWDIISSQQSASNGFSRVQAINYVEIFHAHNIVPPNIKITKEFNAELMNHRYLVTDGSYTYDIQESELSTEIPF